MTEKAAIAKNLFKEGYSCSQAVAVAYAEEMGLSKETAARLASPFGGGMGRMREVCGAVSGMLMVLGMLYGYDDPQDAQSKRQVYALTQQLAARYREENGSIICRELLGLGAGVSDPNPEARTETYYRKRPCADLVACAVDILEEYRNSLK